MTRDPLYRAADRVDEAAEAADPDASDRLAGLAGQLRSQADREATPALGGLDRIHSKLRDVEGAVEDPEVAAPIADAREDVLSFLETLPDRGMRQHGRSEN
ncbi:hypothetical protein BRD00_04890 [Halobacteriales archaeon QS_8_69_26]|nr:MAG: hypothetical protein BRD00_04890 [Halobacteriales archaeon QS_8_69_26]